MAVKKSSPMSEAEYKERRLLIENIYPAKGALTDARSRALASLYFDSQWTQERIALFEGITQQRTAQLIRYGEFLTFTTRGCIFPQAINNKENPESSASLFPKSKITERKFREYWDKTKNARIKTKRFEKVAQLIDAENTGAKIKMNVDKPTTKHIPLHFGDGKWHTFEAIGQFMGVDLNDKNERRKLQARLTTGKNRNIENYIWEFRKHRATTQWRFTKGSTRKIDLKILKERIAPLLQELKILSKTNAATVSPPCIGIVAKQIENLLEELSQ